MNLHKTTPWTVVRWSVPDDAEAAIFTEDFCHCMRRNLKMLQATAMDFFNQRPTT